MTLNAERVTFTKKKKTVACPVPLAPLADTHAHLLSFWGKEVPETLVRAKAAGVDLLVTMFDPIADKRSVQIDCMARQLELAVCRNVPVELHLRHEDTDQERTSHVDAYNVLREVGVPQAGCVLHCFGEDRATMERFVELGCYIAYGGAATFKRNDDVREAFAATPLDRILFETDCPYMAPEPIRGLECEPAMISITANALVNDRVDRTGEDAETIVQAAWENACKLFQK